MYAVPLEALSIPPVESEEQRWYLFGHISNGQVENNSHRSGTEIKELETCVVGVDISIRSLTFHTEFLSYPETACRPSSCSMILIGPISPAFSQSSTSEPRKKCHLPRRWALSLLNRTSRDTVAARPTVTLPGQRHSLDECGCESFQVSCFSVLFLGLSSGVPSSDSRAK